MGKQGIRRGLVLGKFAPLHKGHQYLIETALAEMEEVIVMIYDCPDVIGIPLAARADWIRQLYPQVEVVEAWNGPTETGYTPEIKKMHEDYVLSIIDKKITHFYSSEPYGEHMSRALSAVNRIVDMDRKKYPISGTAVRDDAWKNKKFLDPVVYRDCIKKIVFLGAESSGKSTIAEELARAYGTRWMPEYGREFWIENNRQGKLTPEQLLKLAQEHLRREENLLLSSDRFLFIDTNAITTEMFSRYYHGYALPQLERLGKEAENRYDLFFVCGTEIPYEEDGTRSGEAHRQQFQKEIIADLDRRGVKYVLLEGTLTERIDTARKTISRLI